MLLWTRKATPWSSQFGGRAEHTTASPGGVQSFLSWERLARLLDEHECREREAVTHLRVDESGITVVFGRR